MKLSLKFFCIAYAVVLLSTGIGGIFLIKNATDTLWESQTERVSASMNYACDSFISIMDISSGKIEEKRLSAIEKQVISVLDRCISDIQIIPQGTSGGEYLKLEDNRGFTRYFREGNKLIMESVCRLNTGREVYFLALYSDFTHIESQSAMLWRAYGIVVLLLSAVSGGTLYILALNVTKPIKKLTKAANSISLGEYGETVGIKTDDVEIRQLSESFNKMSLTVKEKIEEIQEESDKRNMFVADFAHELKTPMTAIIGYAQMLNAYDLTRSEIKQASKAIYKEGKRLESLSKQMLDLYVYRNEDVSLEPICLSDIIKQLETTLIFLSRKYNVGFSVDFGDETVMANPVLLLSLIYNLSDNAFKASEPENTIMIYSQAEVDKVRITVKDNGKGIAPENIKMLTEPFFREDKARSRSMGGAGLGLSLCKEIALLHGTELDFQSQLGEGTTVSFWLEAEHDE